MPTLEQIAKELEKIRAQIPGIQAGIAALPKPTVAAPTVPTTPVTPTTPALGATTPTAQDYSQIWTTEYGKSGLEDVKTKIAGFDTDITARKTARDQALLDEKGKPIPQWMITGRKALEIEAATNDINRLIDQRNAAAGQFNAGVAEVERKVGYAIDWQKELQRQLGEKAEAERWEKSFALQLEEAGRPKTASVTYESGGRQYLRTYNTITGETIKVEDLGPVKVEPGKAPADIETYARGILAGTYSETGVPADIRTQVMNRVTELRKTERTQTDEEIRAKIRTQIRALKADTPTITDDAIRSYIQDQVSIDGTLTKADRERINLILGEILPEAKPAEEKKPFWKFWQGPSPFA